MSLAIYKETSRRKISLYILFHPVLQTIRKGGIAVMVGNNPATQLNLLQQRSITIKTSTYIMTSRHKQSLYLKEI